MLSQRSPSAGVIAVNSTIGSVMLLSANDARVGAYFYNNSTNFIYIKLGRVATTSSFTIMLEQGGFYELHEPVYIGRIDGIFSGTGGACQITELF